MQAAVGRSKRTLWLVIATQVTCLFVGYWIFDRYVGSLVREQARQEAFAELEGFAADAATELEALAKRSTPWPEDLLERVEQVAPLLRRRADDRLLLVDGSSRPIQALDSEIPEFQWTEQSDDAHRATTAGNVESPKTSTRGNVQVAEKSYLAVAQELVPGQLYLLAARDTRALSAGVEGLAGPLFFAALMAFVWTAAAMAVATYVILSRQHDQYSQRNDESEASALKRTEEMLRMREAVIFGLAKLTESRDPETGYHLERISLYSARLALALRRVAKFRRRVTPEFIELIGTSSILHDIGKVGVEDDILLKPAKLDPHERQRMQRHVLIGGECLRDIERRLGSSNFLQMAREIAFSHHEHWDGGGYPFGLEGEEIPLAARIVAIADVYEALSNKRVYKEAIPHEECVDYIREQAGTQFDPDLVEVFMTIETQFRNVAREFANERREPSDPLAVAAGIRDEDNARGDDDLSNFGDGELVTEIQRPSPSLDEPDR